MPAPLLAATAAYALALRALRRVDPELRWDWRTIDAADLAFARAFPENFLWGVATSAHQVEGGCDNNQWSRWERSRGPDGAPRIKHGDVSGAACEHWARYPEDIARMRALGVDAYRFSVEWSKIEPREGDYNDAAMQFPANLVARLFGFDEAATLQSTQSAAERSAPAVRF